MVLQMALCGPGIQAIRETHGQSYRCDSLINLVGEYTGKIVTASLHIFLLYITIMFNGYIKLAYRAVSGRPLEKYNAQTWFTQILLEGTNSYLNRII